MLHWTSLSAPTPALLLLPLAFALAIVPPLENPALLAENGLPLANASELQYDLPLTNLNASPQCDGAQYGRNLRSASCDEVLELVHPSSNDAVVEYGQRGHYAGINKLPVRWLSSDGTCALDIVHKPGVWQDKTRQSKIWEAANAIVIRCVKAAPTGRNAGGAVGEIGDNGGLIVIIRSYQLEFSCSALADQPGQAFQEGCQDLIPTLPVSHQAQVYGTPPQPSIEVVLPKAFTAPHSNCIGYLTARDNMRFTSSAYDIWAAASALETLCIRSGKTGMAKVAVNAQGTLILILSTFALSGSSTIGNNSTVTALGTGSDLAASQ